MKREVTLTESKMRSNYIKRYIKESVRQVLNEFMQEGFSFERMNSLKKEKRVAYCVQYLGEPIGEGSSRTAFEIDDAQVLKIAYGKFYKAGCAQNKAEYEISKNIKTPILVKTLYKAKDYSWIISERVIPCEELDFYKVMGLPYTGYKTENYDENVYNSKNKDLLGYNEYSTDKINGKDKSLSFVQVKQVMKHIINGLCNPEQFPNESKIIENHPWFKELYILATKYNLDLDDVGIGNLGITLRNGKPTIVILDSGLTKEVWDKFY